MTAERGVPPIPDRRKLCQAFGRPLQRKLRGDGVMFSGLTYSCDALREAFLHSSTREVEIRVNLQNMGWIAVEVGASWCPAIVNQSGFEKQRPAFHFKKADQPLTTTRDPRKLGEGWCRRRSGVLPGHVALPDSLHLVMLIPAWIAQPG